ncbi:MAG: fibronectin type III domain-containing protein, partial [Candidatus Dojkabacteria bacterium]
MNHQKIRSTISKAKDTIFKSDKSTFKSKTVFLGILAVVLLVGFIFLSRVKSAPHDVSLSTISSNSFTVSFFTDWKAKPVLEVADNPDFKNTIEFIDDRDYYANDTKDKRNGRNSHVFVARNLDPETQYWFRVKTFLRKDYDKEFYTVKTPGLSNYVPTPHPVFGQVFNQKGGPQGNILIEIYAQRDDGERSSSIITYTDSDSGTYSHDLSNLRTRDASEYWDFNKQEYPNKLVITAMSNNERYAYEVYDLDNVSPVRTFEFREVDEDYATLPFFKPALAQDSRQGQPCGDGRYYSDKGNCLSLCTPEVNKNPPGCSQT